MPLVGDAIGGGLIFEWGYGSVFADWRSFESIIKSRRGTERDARGLYKSILATVWSASPRLLLANRWEGILHMRRLFVLVLVVRLFRREITIRIGW